MQKAKYAEGFAPPPTALVPDRYLSQISYESSSTPRQNKGYCLFLQQLHFRFSCSFIREKIPKNEDENQKSILTEKLLKE